MILPAQCKGCRSTEDGQHEYSFYIRRFAQECQAKQSIQRECSSATECQAESRSGIKERQLNAVAHREEAILQMDAHDCHDHCCKDSSRAEWREQSQCQE